MTRITSLIFIGVTGATVLMIALCWSDPFLRDDLHGGRDKSGQSIAMAVAAGADVSPDRARAEPLGYAVTVNRPTGAPLVEITGVDPQGRSGAVACSTCHSVREPNRENRTAATLDEFHQGLAFDHGTLACYSCHHPDQADSLRLAEGTAIEYADVMQLCSQCHSAQATAYAHGAHGGMNGHWDLSRGPQTKNNCVDCHDPHVPKFPQMIVGFKPRDRFLEAEANDVDHNK